MSYIDSIAKSLSNQNECSNAKMVELVLLTEPKRVFNQAGSHSSLIITLK